MKFYITIGFLILGILNVKADDLTFNVKNTVKGGNTGAIDLTISGDTGPYSVSWTGPNGFTANTEDINNLTAGTYMITVNDHYCGVAKATVDVKDFTTGIDEMSAEQILVFPNPMNAQLNISLPDEFKNYQLRLLNALGEVISEKANAVSSVFITVDELAAGVYFLEITTENKVYRKKVVKN